MKNLLWLAILVFLFSCKNQETKTPIVVYTTLQGQTMGTTYSVKYSSEIDHKTSIDSILVEVNGQVNTYDPNSLISQFNQGTEIAIHDSLPNYFQDNYRRAQEIYKITEGSFDPTVMPLVYYWGFGKNKVAVENADASKIKELQSYIGFDKIEVSESKMGMTYFTKQNPNTQLDFSGIAKGYGADQIANFLTSRGIENYLVEIGGDGLAKGTNPTGQPWVIGINTPKEDADPRMDFKALVQLQDKAVATSGNYRNYYEVDGKKYAHTINPKTGYPEMSNLLSVSVATNDGMSADAFATAFMVMGLERSIELAENLPEIDAYFIYDENGTMKVKATSGFQSMILQENE